MLLKENFVIFKTFITVIKMKYVLLSIDSFYKNMNIQQHLRKDMGKMKSMPLPFYDI